VACCGAWGWGRTGVERVLGMEMKGSANKNKRGREGRGGGGGGGGRMGNERSRVDAVR